MSTSRARGATETIRGHNRKRLLSIMLTVFMVLALIPVMPATPAHGVTANDIAGHWAEAQVSDLISKGTISGYPDGSFKPNGKITRAEFASIIVNGFKLSGGDGKVFADTEKHWAKEAIATANFYGIVNGYSDSKFGPNDPITREQMAVMVVKAAKLAEASTEKIFADNNSISSWAKAPVNISVGNNIITGYPDNTFKPKGNASRAEAAVVLFKSLTPMLAADITSITVTGQAGATKITIDNGTLQMLAEVIPSTAIIKTVTWSVTEVDGSESDKATIDKSGLLTAVKDGKVKVKATSTSAPTVSGELLIEMSNQLIPSTIIFSDPGPLGKIVADTPFTNKVTAGVGDGNITYASETPATATVNKETGEVSIVAVGSTEIIATKAASKTHGTATNSYRINVTILPTLQSTIIFDDRGPITKRNGDDPFTNKVSGGEGDGTITYASDNPTTATVDKTSGQVTIVGSGSTVITATKALTKTHGEARNSYTLEVTEKPIIKMNPVIGEVKVGVTLTAGDLIPSGATATYSWFRRAPGAPSWDTIPGATTNTYTPITADTNLWIMVIAKATGNYAGEVSKIPGAVKGLVDPITKVTVIGVPEVGVELIAELTPKEATASYQWKRLQTRPSFILEDIPGATSNKYTPTEADKGWALVAQATGTGDYIGKTVTTNTAQVRAATLIPSTIVLANNGPIEKKVGDPAFTNWVTGGIGDGSIAYTSENPEVATVNKTSGEVTLLAPGTVTITLTKSGTSTHRYLITTYTINVAKGPYVEPEFAGGSGTVGDPYQVSTANQLNNVRDHLDKHFIQTKHIYLNVDPWVRFFGWLPIGNRNYNDHLKFTGSYNGQNYVIEGLTLKHDGEWANSIALFGITGKTAELRNIKLENVKIEGKENTASLVGQNNGSITNCHSTGSVTSKYSFVGGLVGHNSGTIYKSHSSVNVNGGYQIGGLVGVNSTGTITECFALGDVKGNGGDPKKPNDNENMGGLVGSNNGHIYNSYASGSVTGSTKKENIGGLVGVNTGSIDRCDADGPVKGSTNVGGLVGRGGGTLFKCSSFSDVQGVNGVGGLIGSSSSTIVKCNFMGSVNNNPDRKSNATAVGGLVGYNYGSINTSHVPDTVSVFGGQRVGGIAGINEKEIVNSYARCTVSGSNYIGGLVGENTDKGDVRLSYATGLVTGTFYPTRTGKGFMKRQVAGIAGLNDGLVQYCYYDKNSTGQDDSGKGYPKSTKDMYKQSTFVPWDFSGTWTIASGYPILRE